MSQTGLPPSWTPSPERVRKRALTGSAASGHTVAHHLFRTLCYTMGMDTNQTPTPDERDIEAARAGRRAVLDPGAFVKRGPDPDDGTPYGERLDMWQERALLAAVASLGARPAPVTEAVEPGVWRHEDGTKCPNYPDSFNFTYVDQPWLCIHGRLICHRTSDAPVTEDRDCPSNIACRGTCRKHTPLRPEHYPAPVADDRATGWTIGGRPVEVKDGRLVEPGRDLCVHHVGLTPGLWCGGCRDALAPSDEAARLRTAIETLAAEIEDPRVQRPGMQRRREWAGRLRYAARPDHTPDGGS